MLEPAPVPASGTVPDRPIGISSVVGDTPLIRLDRLYPDSGVEVYAKLEMMNPGGSAKDRPALAMVQEALKRGLLRPGGTVVESTSGNLGIALARVCAAHSLRFVSVVDARANRSAVATIRALGGEVSTVTAPDPETGDFLTARLRRVQELLRQIPGAVNLDQYANPANPAAHCNGTMREVVEALDGQLDVMMAAVSTAGTLAGCAAHLRERDLPTKVVAVDAVGSVLFGGEAGPRPLPGMGAGVVSPTSALVHPDEVIRVDGVQCVIGARLLARAEGILAGASTGGVVHALGTMARRLEPGSRVAIVVHDGGMPYLETVYDDAWVSSALSASPADIDAGTATLLRDAARG